MAQSPAPPAPSTGPQAPNGAPPAPAPVDANGLPAVDLITLGAIGPGAPLRNGNVIPNSESVQLNGTSLTPNVDYLMDYGVGVVYLKVSQTAGQTLSVSYRYKPGPVPPGTPATQVASASPFTYAIAPGALSLMTGFGIAERGADGSVMSSNMFGLTDTFKLAQGGSLSGIFMVGDSIRENNSSAFSLDTSGPTGPSSPRAGQSQLIVQNMRSSLLGGSATVNYQEVDSNFMGFNSLTGVDPALVKQLNAERGLTRFGFGLNNMQLGSFGVSDNYREVKEGAAGIVWNSYALQNGGLRLNWTSQSVDSRFNRFKDLNEANKDQLGKEAGMTRNTLTGDLARSFGKISYKSTKISDDVYKTNINRSEWALNSSKLRFNMGDESVDGTFMRMSSLMAPEQAEYGREIGVKRQWLGLQAGLLGPSTPFSFNQTMLTSNVGRYSSQDASIGSSSWSLQHADVNSSTGFTSMGALSDVETAATVRTIANMYSYNITPSPSDQSEFLGTTGIDRKYDGFSTDAIKGWKLTASALELKGLTDKGQVDSASLAGKNVILNYRKEELGAQFDEINNMMDLEKLRLGTLQGLNRTDIGLEVLTGKAKLDVNSLQAESLTGSVERNTVTYDDPNKLNVQLGQRSATSGFLDGPSLVDPEAQLLGSLRGFNEEDAKVKWAILPGMTLNTFDEQQVDPESRQTWSTRNTTFDWANKTTAFNYTDLEQHNNDPLSTIFASVVDKMSLTKDFGRFGILKVAEENDEYDGMQQNQLDQHLRYLGYQTPAIGSTTFKTEQTLTTYANGQTEEINANTVSTNLNKRTGVSVTDTEVDRAGDTDESHRNYGFWYDFGNGVKVSYGYAKSLAPDPTQNNSSSTFAVGKSAPAGQPVTAIQPGQVGNLMMGAVYANQWDADNHTQTNGNVALSTVKPFKLGFIDDAKITVNMDTGTDYSRTLHEDKLFSGQGRIGTYNFGYEYKSQMDPLGNRAIDRTFKLATDPSDKKFISAAVSYKGRTMDYDDTIIIRDYNLTMRPAKNVTLTNLLQTNPDVANPGVILGSIPQASRSDKWMLDYKQNANLTVGGVYQELINDSTMSSSQVGGVTAKLFEKSGSPVTLFYGIENANQTDLWRNTQRYSLEYDQKAGPRQTFSLFVGSLSYEHMIPQGQRPENNTLRVNYLLRF